MKLIKGSVDLIYHRLITGQESGVLFAFTGQQEMVLNNYIIILLSVDLSSTNKIHDQNLCNSVLLCCWKQWRPFMLKSTFNTILSYFSLKFIIDKQDTFSVTDYALSISMCSLSKPILTYYEGYCYELSVMSRPWHTERLQAYWNYHLNHYFLRIFWQFVSR